MHTIRMFHSLDTSVLNKEPIYPENENLIYHVLIDVRLA